MTEPLHTGGRRAGDIGDAGYRLLVQSVRDYAIFMLDPQGYILTWNAGAQRIKGYEPEEIIGQHFSRFYPAEALGRGHPDYELRVAIAEGRFEEEGWRLRKDGSRFWANVVITALRDASGKLIGFGKVTRDLTRRREFEQSLRESEERFRLLVEGVAEYAIFMLDANGYVATWNSGAERINGYRAEEIVGQHFSRFYPADAVESGWPEHELQVATSEGRYEEEGWRVRKDGSQFWASIVITALRDESGNLKGFAKLTRDLSERQRALFLEADGMQREQLLEAERTARIEAQRVARMKDEFLATLSHELRTPLNAILGWTQVMRMPGSGSAQLEQGLEVIERNARSQAQLIDDLLDLSRILAGRMRLDVQHIALVDVVRGALESVMPAAQGKGIRLESMLDPNAETVAGDPARLQQVVWNLLSNAIKFTPKGGRVQVLLARVNSHVEIRVSDTGIGIPAAFLPRVFERFSQRDSRPNRTYGGLGLGLAISKQLVELHGGTIQAASPGEGQGATFTVRLPLTMLHSEEKSSDRVHPTHPTMPDATPLPRLDGVRVLVVEDETDARELIAGILAGQGAAVRQANSAEESLAKIASEPPDVLVCDIGMPGIDGYQLMRTIRAREPKGRRLPALALTAFARPEDRKRSMLAGYQSHLAKPFDVAELVLQVATLAERT
jgi:PAS domain S-box-containing protein